MTHHDRQSRQQAEALLQRASDDAVWLSALRDAYRGPHDVLDALWWQARPLTVAPSGTPYPGADITRLQRAVYSRPTGDNPQRSESAQQLRQLLTILEQDATVLTEAIAAASAGENPNDSQAAETPSRLSAPATGVLGTTTDTALGLLIFVPTIPSEDAVFTEAPPAAALPPQPGERVQMEIVPLSADAELSDPMEILNRPIAEGDRPAESLERQLEEGSYRKLPDLIGNVSVYLARSVEPGGICLSVARRDGGALSGCVSDDTFARDGISIRGSERYEIWPGATILSESFALSPTGDFQYEAIVRAPVHTSDPAESSPT